MSDIPKQFEIQFIKKVQVSTDAWSFYFDKPDDCLFEAGQYLQLKIPHEGMDVRGDSRLFTISSSPTEPELMITTRIIQSSFKHALFNLKTAAAVSIKAPYGRFIFDEENSHPHVFLAGGIGITPLRSMARYAYDKKLQIPVTFFTSFRTVEDIIFSDELRKIASACEWFRLIETVTRPEDSRSPWTGETGRINGDLIKKYLNENFLQATFYISGPATMVDALSEMVSSLQVKPVNILREKFTGY